MKNYWTDLYIKIINQFLIDIINNVIELLHYLMLVNWGIEAWICGIDKVSHGAIVTAIRKMIGQTLSGKHAGFSSIWIMTCANHIKARFLNTLLIW